jgi:ribonucleotide reductase alpha subunit
MSDKVLEGSDVVLSPIAEDICKKRYYQKDENGQIKENWHLLTKRVVDFVCCNEPEEIKKQIFDLILGTYFVPNSPCLVNAGGKSKSAGIMACFVTKDPDDCWSSAGSPDSVGMVENIANFGHIARCGGGCGFNVSKIRPEGDFVFGSTHAKACGPIEHMRMISEVMSSITQSGFRAMAMMAVMNINHPDIFKFIQCKQSEKALKSLLKDDFFNQYDLISKNISNQLKAILDKFLHNFNLSVFTTDHFMNQVKNDGDFNLEFNGKVYKTIKARELFNTIAENAWKNGDPGFLFGDTINNTSPYRFSGQKISATNPCFHGDSLVMVADGRNLVSIKQLAEEGKDVPLYCCDPKNGNIHIKYGRNPRKTRENVKVCKVTFDDGGSVITTPDHKIITRNGKKREVKDLEPGDSVMSMTKFQMTLKHGSYWSIYRGKSNSIISEKNVNNPEHRMIYEFYTGETLTENDVIHHKNFTPADNSINNLQKMTYDEHGIYHRQFNNPMTHWYPNATEEERQRYHDRMSEATSGEKNGMFGKKHSKETKEKIGKKTRERCSNLEYRKNLGIAIKESYTEELRKKVSDLAKIRWESGKYDSIKKIKSKICEFCGKEFNTINGKFCSVKCSGMSMKGVSKLGITDQDFINNAIEFVNLTGYYPSVITWENFEGAIGSREMIRQRFSNFKNLNDQLVDNGIFADITPNTNYSQKMILGMIVNWTNKNARVPSKKELLNIVCKKTVSKYGGYDSLILKANELSLKTNNNHKVVSVEFLDELTDVYNITVDDYHNLCIFTSSNTHIAKCKGRRHKSCTQCGVMYANCGEICSPEISSCNLSSIDLSKYYDEKTNNLKWEELKKCIHLTMRFLDDVIDVNKYPTVEFHENALKNRPVGLGMMGFADLLLQMKVTYGSDESIKIAEEIGHFFQFEAHQASVALAKERGTPEACNYKELEYRRNVTTLSIAPTGTISQLANCSSGIEPIYSLTVVRQDNTGRRVVSHPDIDKEYFRCAIDPEKIREVSFEQHIKIQAAFQKYVDASISKTINLPNDATIDTVKKAYMLAYESGCKGITIYRDGSKSFQVLNTSEKEAEKGITIVNAPKRPKSVQADIFKIKAIGRDWYVIIGKVNKMPYEVFAVGISTTLPDKGMVIKRKSGHYSLLDEGNKVLIENLSDEERAIDASIELETRRFSLMLRHGIHPKFIVQQINRSNDVISSFSNAVKRIFATKYLNIDDKAYISKGVYCPECAENGKMTQMIADSTCWICPECNYSKCG